MLRLTCISGLEHKAPACFLLETGSKRLLLDLGEGASGELPDLRGVGPVDAILISHGHGDHVDGLKLRDRIGSPPVYGSEYVAHKLRTSVEVRPLPLRGRTPVEGIIVETGRSGHAPGGIWMAFEGTRRLTYMGDHFARSPVYAADPPPPTDILILDASYKLDEPDFDAEIAALGDRLKLGPTILPVPADGRALDIALHAVRDLGLDVSADSAVRETMRDLIEDFPGVFRDGVRDELRRILPGIRDIDPERPSGVMLVTPASVAHGVAADLLRRWSAKPEPAIVFTGHVEGVAKAAVQSGRASWCRWSVHPPLAERVELGRSTGARTVIPAFGGTELAGQWRNIFAPASVPEGTRFSL
ncbi:RNA processing exonuclease, beta-lactamase fold, Cft2 family [Faunimonas pinastri]|uniref:RNA processing exonuclease, beta-lactamase fold, Cft2 family n=1 Tax=Faunimonas pinastri TaxID=1855383 RepID=A0A1H9AA92_9HYPH|nr:MBL fold metallo-hydrolase [Faunimonas pinastri]SEP73652.1 RNA processing exonuclease, beta-lactamase fold, Cft2 family [Faunimonas pinastri]